MGAARVWVLLYSRTGDNNQALSLAQSLGLPYEAKMLRYNWLRGFGRYMGPSLLTIDGASRQSIRSPWPELVVTIGRWSVPVVRAIKKKSDGRTKVVFLGNPRINPGNFDLVLATRDYLDPRGDNVVVVPLPMALPPAVSNEDDEPESMGELPHPRTLLLIGAPVKYWDLTESYLHRATLNLVKKANAADGSILVSGSPRTPDSLMLAAERALVDARHGWMARSRRGGLNQLFEAADEVVVTGDSMSMVTEAVLTGKPVGILPLELSEKGSRKLGAQVAQDGSASKRRDLRRFWSELWKQGLAGTVMHPRAANIVSSAASSALIVVSLLSVSQIPDAVLTSQAQSGEETSFDKPGLKGIAGIFPLLGSIEHALSTAQRDAGALWLAAWDPQTPWYAKLVAGISSVSAMSPIDLTPDFIPIFGYLDDLFLLVVGTFLFVRMIPRPLLADLRARAISMNYSSAKRSAMVVFGIWIAATFQAILRMSGFYS